MAGHSHWANIKRQKGAADAKRGKIWGKIARKLIIAAKSGGDPRENLSLRYVVDEAKAANMPKETIEKAILKGTGEMGSENYEEVTYEGYGPGGVAILVEALTDNRARTAPEMRFLFERHGGNLAASGAVGFVFTRQGVITMKAEGMEEDKLLEAALEAGAEDVRDEGEVLEVMVSPAAYQQVKEAIEESGIAIEAAEIANLPNNTVAVDGETAQRVLKLIEALEDNDDVQSVSHNAEIPEGAASAAS